MTPSSDDELQELQSEVQRLLGRCLLRLQQYERLIKVIIAQQKISGPVHDLERMQAARIADSARKTLGTLVGDLIGSYIVANQSDSHLNPAADFFENANSISIGTQIALSDADFEHTKNGLRELVLLRNDLVHHFIDQYASRAWMDAVLAAMRWLMPSTGSITTSMNFGHGLMTCGRCTA